MATTNGRLPKQEPTERIIRETLRRIRGELLGAGGGGGSGGSGTPTDPTTFTAPFVPLRIFSGTTYVVPVNTQLCAAFPIVIESGGILDIVGAFAMVN